MKSSFCLLLVLYGSFTAQHTYANSTKKLQGFWISNSFKAGAGPKTLTKLTNTAVGIPSIIENMNDCTDNVEEPTKARMLVSFGIYKIKIIPILTFASNGKECLSIDVYETSYGVDESKGLIFEDESPKTPIIKYRQLTPKKLGVTFLMID